MKKYYKSLKYFICLILTTGIVSTTQAQEIMQASKIKNSNPSPEVENNQFDEDGKTIPEFINSKIKETDLNFPTKIDTKVVNSNPEQTEFGVDPLVLKDRYNSESWTQIESQDFEGAFPTGNWSRNAYGADAVWDDWSCWANSGSWSCGCADYGSDGIGCDDNYPNDMNSWLFYGPIDLTNCSDFDFQFYYNLNCEPGFDYFYVGVSDNGQYGTYSGTQWDGTNPNGYYDFDGSSYAGSSEVWIGFKFFSDNSVPYANGAQIDDVTIWKNFDAGTWSLDLVGGSFSPNPVYENEILDITVDILNTGTASASGVEIKYYLSTNDIISPSDCYLDNDFVYLSPGQTGTENESIDLSGISCFSPGLYYVGVYFPDTDYGWLTTQLEILPVQQDLELTGGGFSPDPVCNDGTLSITAEITNVGSGPAVNAPVEYYLSPDTDLNPSVDYYLGNDLISLSPGQTGTESINANLSSLGISPGNYYVMVNFPDEGNWWWWNGQLEIIDCSTPSIELTPSSHNFGTETVGNCTSNYNFTLTSTGTATATGTVSLSGSNTNHYQIVTGGGSFSLAPGATKTIAVKFCPQSSGSKSSTLLANGDSPCNDDQSTLLGYGEDLPEISLTPASHDFGEVQKGDCSSTFDFILNSTGNATATGTVSLTGSNASHFEIVTNGGSFTLPPGWSKTITVRFCPLSGTTSGLKSATLLANGDSPCNDDQSSVIGDAIDPDAPQISLTPSSHDFGNIYDGECSSVFDFTLTSTGNATATGNVSLSGSNVNHYQIVSGDGAFSLAPGATKTITIKFCPQSVGPKPSTLLANGASPCNDDQADLSGTGLPPETDPIIMSIPDDIMGAPNDLDVAVPILMDSQTNNNGPVASLQMTVLYDASKGLSLTNNSYALTGRTSGFSVSMSVNENGSNSTVQILIFNTSGGTIAEGTGSIINLLFDVSGNAIIDDQIDICFDDCIISDAQANQIPADITDCGLFTIGSPYDPCDINMDGFVNILDLQIVINVILGNDTNPTHVQRSDLNGDSNVNILDLQMEINCILNSDNQSYYPPSNKGNNTIILPDENLEADATGSFGLGLNNQDAVSSGQIVFYYDSNIGFDISGANKTSRTNPFSHVFQKDDSDPSNVKITILFYTLSADQVQPGTGDIFTLNWETTGSATGTTTMLFDQPQTLLSDQNANSLALNFTDGSVNIGGTGACDPGWEFTETPLPHYITVPLSANPMIFDEALEAGDFIGVFYLDDSNEEACGGFTEWTGTENVVVIAFGDDNTTPEKDGFATGEVLNWKIYDCSEEVEYSAFATYDQSMQNSDGTFAPYGLSKLLSLETNICQEMNIPSGWSGVSLFLEPENPAVADIFQSIVNEFVIMSNLSSVYWPDNSINTIGNWDNTSAYAIKLDNSNVIELCGIPVIPSTLNLSSGWHYLPVLAGCPVNVEDLFSSVVNDIVIVQEIAGTGVYWPDMGVNTLDELLPGNGYAIKTTSEISIDFPACTKSSDFEAPFQTNEFDTPWGTINATPAIHSIAINGQNNQFENAIIGAFDINGNCYGYGQLAKTTIVMSVFGDDPMTTPKDGFAENEPIEFRLWYSENQHEELLDVVFDHSLPNASALFDNYGLSAIKEMKVSAVSISEVERNTLVTIMPNPADEAFVLSIETDHQFDGAYAQIYDMSGNMVRNINLSNNQSKVNINALKPGVYVLRIEVNGEIFNKRLVKY